MIVLKAFTRPARNAGLYDRLKFCTNNLASISYSKQVGGLTMKFIKIILAILGLMFGVMLFFWLFGLITSLLWYGFWIGMLAAAGYGGYRLFKKAENKYVGAGPAVGYIDDERDFNLSWEEYDRKYLKK